MENRLGSDNATLGTGQKDVLLETGPASCLLSSSCLVWVWGVSRKKQQRSPSIKMQDNSRGSESEQGTTRKVRKRVRREALGTWGEWMEMENEHKWVYFRMVLSSPLYVHDASAEIRPCRGMSQDYLAGVCYVRF